MGIYLELVGVGGDRVYTQYDAVKGVLHLKLDRPTVISNITVFLEGSVKTSLIQAGSDFILGDDTPKVDEERQDVVKRSKRLLPSSATCSTSLEYTVPKGHHKFPFELSLCALHDSEASSTSMADRQLVLPPSFETASASQGAAASIAYDVKVVVRRPGLRKQRSTEERIYLLPESPALRFLPLSISFYQTRRTALYAPRPIGLEASHLSTAKLERTPILFLEATLSSPFLRAGENLPLRVFVRRIPDQTGQYVPIALKRLYIMLRSSTSVTAGPHSKSWTSLTALLNLEALDYTLGCSLGRGDLFEIDNGTLQHASVPGAIPSFTTDTVERTYSLLIGAAFTMPGQTKMTSVNLAINVEILSGSEMITHRNAGAPSDITERGEERILELLRPGCLARLAASGGTGEEERLPPYVPAMSATSIPRPQLVP
ncbi:uncharacterized protein BDV17DRAFT_289925 [Aspergillus undulatus]|uniref:uncharacterized protein n=1 Tax=Aspergillus undulatus TaxID=1810928 RepID=UPI003CCE2448